jgi:DNA-binding NtrC family response regulator
MGKILLVEDAAVAQDVLASLRLDGHEIWECQDVESARRNLAAEKYDVVFVDQQMPGCSAVVASARDSDPTVSVILLGAMSDVGAGEKAVSGNFELPANPLQPAAIRAIASCASDRTHLLRENASLRQLVEQLQRTSEVQGDISAIRTVRGRIAHLARSDVPVLISGELGTGKEVLARTIHRASPRGQKPFVPVNCAALSETTLESELFGHESDAVTAGRAGRPSLFESAYGGTLFLDAVEAIPRRLQHRLERVLVFSQVLRIGAVRPRAVDVRVLAATHVDLQQQVQQGQFRETLFLRLAVTKVHLPPLRDRLDDVPLLCQVFSRQIAAELRVAEKNLSPAAVEILRRYAFPGNLRELRNLIERAYLLSDRDQLLESDFPLAPAEQKLASVSRSGSRESPAMLIAPADRFNLTEVLEQTEKALITQVLAATRGAQAEAARRMGLSRSVLAYKLNKYGIRISA